MQHSTGTYGREPEETPEWQLRLQMEETLGLPDDRRSLQRIESTRRTWPTDGSLGREGDVRV